MQIKIMLEWFLNPNHMPFIYGIESGIFKQSGFDVELIEPNYHYDGFEYLKMGIFR